MDHATMHGYGILEEPLGSRWVDCLQSGDAAVRNGEIDRPLHRRGFGASEPHIYDVAMETPSINTNGKFPTQARANPYLGGLQAGRPTTRALRAPVLSDSPQDLPRRRPPFSLLEWSLWSPQVKEGNSRQRNDKPRPSLSIPYVSQLVDG